MRRVRLVMVPLVLVLVACLGMRPAFADWNDGGAWNVDDADMGIKWGPTAVDGDRKGFVMVSDNRYNACLILCGISINDERLTADAKAKLSNSDTGGGFYLLAQRFGQYGNEGNLPEWAKPNDVIVPGVGIGFDNNGSSANAAIRTCAAMYGKDATWWGDYTELERTNALKDLVEILNGGNVGGGGGGVTLEDGYYIFKGNVSYFTGAGGYPTFTIGGTKYSYYLGPVRGGSATILPSPLTVRIPAGLLSNFEKVCPSSSNDWACVLTPLDKYFNVSFFAGDFTEVITGTNPVVTDVPAYVYSGLPYIYSIRGEGYTDGTQVEYSRCTYSDGVLTCNVLGRFYTPGRHSFNYLSYAASEIGILFSAGSSVQEPPIPPTQWPDSPTYEQPTAPVVPDPVEPTIPSEPSAPTPVEPVQPDPSAPAQNPVFNDQPTYTNDTFTADLQGILDALNEHCIHLQNALYANISDLYNKLSTKLTNDLSNLKSFLHSEFGWLNDARHDDAVTTWDYLQDLFSWLGGLISDNFYSLNQHLTQLFSWLAEQFDFSFTGTGYNDDTVVSWLKKIYSKLGTGMNTRPNDPVAEPDSFGDWLTRLLQNFISDLLNVGQEAVGGLVNDFQQLATKFPFCVPWDIAALLALFVAEPVAPVFDLPAYTITQDGLSQVSTYHISLADYDVAWEAVRFAEKVGFAVFLAWNTTHFREFLSGRGES